MPGGVFETLKQHRAFFAILENPDEELERAFTSVEALVT